MKILISSRSFNKKSHSLENLKDYEIIFPTCEGKPTEQNILDVIDDKVIGIIAGTENITKSIINKAPNLKVISRYGSGLDNIDLEYVKSKNIKIFNTTSQTLAVAEFTVTLILDLFKKLNLTQRYQWKPRMGNLLTNKTVGIVGYGAIGHEVERLLKPFNVKILYHDINYGKSTGLQEIFEYSDVVTIHLPLNKDTHHFINKLQFNKSNKNLFLINTSRGGIVNEDDLYHAIKDKKIGGAAVDVFEKEPYLGNLGYFDNVIVTPHMASFCQETRVEMEEEAVDNLVKGLK